MHAEQPNHSAWIFEEFPDRPRTVQWTYWFTDKDNK